MILIVNRPVTTVANDVSYVSTAQSDVYVELLALLAPLISVQTGDGIKEGSQDETGINFCVWYSGTIDHGRA